MTTKEAKLPHVAVIMATYNGEKYLREQLDSILAQQGVAVTLHIFDDRSSDGTVDLIRAYQAAHSNVKLTINEQNKGYAMNFMDGVYSLQDDRQIDYFAFADQDDVWLPDKLVTAVDKIKATGSCTLYGSNVQPVDATLQPLSQTLTQPAQVARHDTLLAPRILGCTMVFDRAFWQLLLQHYPKGILTHDYWCELLASYGQLTHLVFDADTQQILYRRHGKNVSHPFRKNSWWRKVPLHLSMFKLLLSLYQDVLAAADAQVIQSLVEYQKPAHKKFLHHNLQCSHPHLTNWRLRCGRYYDISRHEI